MPPHFWDTKDTIAARATAPTGGLRGVIRISGPESIAAAGRLLDEAAASQLASQKQAAAIHADIRLPGFPTAIEAQILAWPDSRSYTRQPSVEIHTLGSPPILDAILERLLENGARAAQPGEFTLRSFLAGRLDLTQAEAVLGVIDAADQSQLDEALGQLAGGLATPLHSLRDQLIELLAHLEAGLDFVDEDIEFITADQLGSDLRDIESAVARIASQLEGRLDRDALPIVALYGLPNAGKSSLFNTLLGESAAIVSSRSGATRDFVSAVWQISDSARCLLVDTAGLDETADGVDALAQQHSGRVRRDAAVRVLCIDGTANNNEPSDDEPNNGRPAIMPPTLGDDATLIVIATKADADDFTLRDPTWLPTSSFDSSGLDELRQRIVKQLLSVVDAGRQATAVRCGESLTGVQVALQTALEAAESGLGEELVAAELRLALDDLGRVVGAIYNDDILDRVFSRFCIGK